MTGQPLKKCPYRKEHEFDADGLCLHCYAEMPHEHYWKNAPGESTWRCDCGEVKVYRVVDTDSFTIPITRDISAFWAPMPAATDLQKIQKAIDDTLAAAARQMADDLHKGQP